MLCFLCALSNEPHLCFTQPNRFVSLQSFSTIPRFQHTVVTTSSLHRSASEPSLHETSDSGSSSRRTFFSKIRRTENETPNTLSDATGTTVNERSRSKMSFHDSDVDPANNPIVERLHIRSTSPEELEDHLSRQISYPRDLQNFLEEGSSLLDLPEPDEDRMSRISDWVEKTKGGSESIDIDVQDLIEEQEHEADHDAHDDVHEATIDSRPEVPLPEEGSFRSFEPSQWRDLHMGSAGACGASTSVGGSHKPSYYSFPRMGEFEGRLKTDLLFPANFLPDPPSLDIILSKFLSKTYESEEPKVVEIDSEEERIEKEREELMKRLLNNENHDASRQEEEAIDREREKLMARLIEEKEAQRSGGVKRYPVIERVIDGQFVIQGILEDAEEAGGHVVDWDQSTEGYMPVTPENSFIKRRIGDRMPSQDLEHLEDDERFRDPFDEHRSKESPEVLKRKRSFSDSESRRRNIPLEIVLQHIISSDSEFEHPTHENRFFYTNSQTGSMRMEDTLTDEQGMNQLELGKEEPFGMDSSFYSNDRLQLLANEEQEEDVIEDDADSDHSYYDNVDPGSKDSENSGKNSPSSKSTSSYSIHKVTLQEHEALSESDSQGRLSETERSKLDATECVLSAATSINNQESSRSSLARTFDKSSSLNDEISHAFPQRSRFYEVDFASTERSESTKKSGKEDSASTERSEKTKKSERSDATSNLESVDGSRGPREQSYSSTVADSQTEELQESGESSSSANASEDSGKDSESRTSMMDPTNCVELQHSEEPIQNADIVEEHVLVSDDEFTKLLKEATTLGLQPSARVTDSNLTNTVSLDKSTSATKQEEKGNKVILQIKVTERDLHEHGDEKDHQKPAEVQSEICITPEDPNPKSTLNEEKEKANDSQNEGPLNSADAISKEEDPVSVHIVIHDYQEVEAVTQDEIVIPIGNKEKSSLKIKRSDTLQSDASEGTNISSDLDRASLVKLPFKSNIDKAVCIQPDKEVKLEDIERFWHYQYTRPTTVNGGAQPCETGPERNKARRASIGDPQPSPGRRITSPGGKKTFEVTRTDVSPSLLHKVQHYYGRRTPAPRLSIDMGEGKTLFGEKRRNTKNISEDSTNFTREMSDIESDSLNEERVFGDEETANSVESPKGDERTSHRFFHLDQLDSDAELDDNVGIVEEETADHDKAQLTGKLLEGRTADDGIKAHLEEAGDKKKEKTMNKLPYLDYKLTYNRLSDSLYSVLSDEEKQNPSVSDENSERDRKSVTFSDKAECVPSPRTPRFLSRTDSALKMKSYKGILKKEDKNRETVRVMMAYAGERFYRDLCMLIEERDRAISALEYLPADTTDLSPQSAALHTEYRDRLLQNKGSLDSKIDDVWNKLKDCSVDIATCGWIYTVADSSQLTMKIKRRVLPRRPPLHHIERKNKSDIELASEYAQKLAVMRAHLVKQDSTEYKDGYLGLLQRVSRTLGSTDALYNM